MCWDFLFVCFFLVLYYEDGMISLSLEKRKGPMYPLLKEIIKETLKCLPLFREFRECIIMAGRQMLEGQFSEKPL